MDIIASQRQFALEELLAEAEALAGRDVEVDVAQRPEQAPVAALAPQHLLLQGAPLRHGKLEAAAQVAGADAPRLHPAVPARGRHSTTAKRSS